MKKLLAIISVLLVIFIGMYIYKSNINQNTLNIAEVQKIEEYISKIYMWQEITEQALPKFDNINDAPELWVWEVVKKNIEEFELEYQQIQEKAQEIFGDKFKKEFPKNGTEYILYDESANKYFSTGVGLDTLDDLFLIKNIKKIKNGYEVEIVEYLEDYGNAMGIEDESEIYNVNIKNLNNETIATIKSNESETATIEAVKKNIEKFNTKILTLFQDKEGNVFLESVK